MTAIYTPKEVLEATLTYFDGDDLASNVWIDKYCLKNNEGKLLEKNPSDMHRRLAKEFARIEKDKYDSRSYITSVNEIDDENKFKNPLSEELIFSLLDKFQYIIPGGSILSGVGNPYQYVSLSNCYLLDIPMDSYGDIMRVDEQIVQVSKRRGGVATDLSNLRPNKFTTQNSSRTSTGIVPFMERYSNSIREVGQSGRRGGIMLMLDVHHPQVLDFATAKEDTTKVTGANISIKISREFLDAVKKNEEYEQRFPINSKNPSYSRMVDANEVWDVIIKQATKTGEPGILLWFNITEQTPADCYSRFKSQGVNLCGEVCLSPLDSCRLLSLNVFSYIDNPFTTKATFNYQKFTQHAKIAQRFMDDMIDLESECLQRIIDKIKSDPEPENVKQREIDLWTTIKIFNDEGRRTGTGVTAIGDTLAGLGIKYGSKKSIEIVGKIYQTLKLGCYKSSVEMAKILGPFKDWNFQLEKEHPFLLRIKEENISLYQKMKKFGRRNIALTTTAPTGSISILAQVSSGIEPLFMLSHTRRKKVNPNDQNAKIDFIDDVGDKWQNFTVHHNKLNDWMNITNKDNIDESPWCGCCANDINWVNRVKLQAEAQKHVCHSISSTLNLPNDISIDEVKKIYLTAATSGCKGITIYRNGSRSGVLVENKTIENNGIKRPKNLPCDIFHISRGGSPHFVLVGLKDNKIYEIFAGSNKAVPDKVTKGTITKVKRGCYKLTLPDGTELCPVTIFCSDEEQSLTRMVSISLRHGVPIKYIVQQLNKSEGEMSAFSKCIARALKNYIDDGTEITGDSCPRCGGELKFQEGCSTCQKCGYSKCM